jgi:hypothetical protein
MARFHRTATHLPPRRGEDALSGSVFFSRSCRSRTTFNKKRQRHIRVALALWYFETRVDQVPASFRSKALERNRAALDVVDFVPGAAGLFFFAHPSLLDA